MSGILGIWGENINVQMKENKLAFAEVRFFEDNAFKQKRTQNYWELKSHFTQKTYFWFQVLEQSDHNGNCSHTQRPQLTPLNFPMIVQDIKNILKMFTTYIKPCGFLHFRLYTFFNSM